jgi:hypothetical protein
MKSWSWTVPFVVVAVAAVPARADFIGPGAPLEKLAKEADLVCKATVVSEVPVTDPWFEPVGGYEVRETELKVVSVVKGPRIKRIQFRHYVRSKTVGSANFRQVHELAVGQTYLLFASASGGDVYRQLSKAPSMKSDQGVLRAADARPHRGKTVTEAVWAELREQLASRTPASALYAIQELDQMTGGQHTGLADFDRTAVLDALRPLVLATSEDVAAAAIGVLGADSPYLDDRDGPFWLAGMGQGTIPGLTPRKPGKEPEAMIAVKELLRVADGRGAASVRALAIRALGRTHRPSSARLTAWGRDPEPAVRRAAILASVELPDRALIQAGVGDGDATVRGTAALAIGFTQDAALVELLAQLLHDGSADVRRAAATSLMSLAPDASRDVMKANLGSECRGAFGNALARHGAAPYVDVLAEVIERRLPQPQIGVGGWVPDYDAWQILFDHVKGLPAEDLRRDQIARALDALERMQWGSSGEPCYLYALYLRRGLVQRAERFREAMRTKGPFQMEEEFARVNRRPQDWVQ